MPIIRLTKHFEIEMAHALKGYNGACKFIHGHSYKLEVTVKGELINDPSSPKNAMLMDFKDLKKIVKSEIIEVYDHALVLQENYDEETEALLAKKEHKVVYMPAPPTCEHLIASFAESIKNKLTSHIKLHSAKLYETATSFGEWYQSDQM